MAWETRGYQRYYYESKRIGGRVIKRYIGTGKVAELIESRIENKKALRNAERAKVRAVEDEVASLEAILDPLDDFALTLAEGAMLAAGYHRTKRGPWRKRRVKVEGSCETHDTSPTRTGSDAC